MNHRPRHRTTRHLVLLGELGVAIVSELEMEAAARRTSCGDAGPARAPGALAAGRE